MNVLWKASLLFVISIVSIQGDDDQELVITPGQVRFFLHTRGTGGATELTFENEFDLDVTKPFKLIVHGYGTDLTAFWLRLLTDAYLRKGDYNVILVDWSPIASLDGSTATAYQPVIGEYVGAIITQVISETPASLDDVHVIGHSMGGQIAGFIGKTVAELSGSKIARVTALDPMRRLGDEDDRLTPNDAEVVDVIHTTFGEDIYPYPMGHVEFYPNGGDSPQPGCTPQSDVAAIEPCSHMRAVYLFIEELENNKGFLGTRCDTLEHFTEGLCIDEQQVRMGADLKSSDEGNYYFYTNAKYPYAVESTVDV